MGADSTAAVARRLQNPMRISLVGLAFTTTVSVLATSPVAGQERPSTRPERSGYLETSRYDDVIGFLAALEGRNPKLQFTTFGYSEEGRRLPLAVFGNVPDASAEAVRSSGATRVLVFANIHAGEVAGKEAAQVLLREMARGAWDRWTDSLVILVAPIYNADGNERIGLRNRPRQYGPLAGMGQRPNARGLDLNRDNTKLESSEARALSRLVQEYDPHVALDLHTTNGSFHAYHLTYSPPLHPSTDEGITALLREDWLPEVTRSVRERYGWEFFYYGNVPGTFGMRGERGWYTFDHRPRYTTNYLGIRNRFGILSEVYSYATFEDRILAHERFVQSVIEFAWAHATRVRRTVEAADAAAAPGMEIALRADLARGDTIDVLMGAVDEERNPYTGELIYRRRDVQTVERMPDYGAFVATEVTRAPAAYVVPADFGSVIERLEAHGVKLVRPDSSSTVDVSVFHLDSTRVAEREFQGHALREVWGEWRTERRELPERTVIVPVHQPLGRLIVLLLEPRSDDGFLAWNLLDDALEGADTYPIGRLEGLPPEGCRECADFQ
jgi:Zinc carboxypeptidase